MDLKQAFFIISLLAIVGNTLLYVTLILGNDARVNTTGNGISYEDLDRQEPNLYYHSPSKSLSNDRGSNEDLDQQEQNLYYHSPLNHIQSRRNDRGPREIVIAIVPCIGRLEEGLNAIRSAIVFANSPLRFLIFTEDFYAPIFQETLEQWKVWTNNSFTFDLHHITYPKSENATEWRRLVVSCASQRLYFPSILHDVDSILFVDTDILFLSPLEEIWNHFSLMNSTQEVALVRECDLPGGGWYEENAKHPYYPPGGLNAAVMLMNLTRMRANHWTRQIVGYYREYKDLLHSGDQDLVNIYTYFYPERLLVLGARYNFRQDSCRVWTVAFKETEELGVAILHGTGGRFHIDRPMLINIFKAWLKYQVGTDPCVNLLPLMEHFMRKTVGTTCQRVHHIFTKGMKSLPRCA